MQGIYIGGFMGSICQLTWITEGSTPFVNLRQILAWHNMQDTTLYLMNGFMMTWSFFWFRVFFYNYMIFWKLQDYVMYRYESFWQTIPEHKHKIAIVSFVCYFVMYGLQLFWFSKILQGLLKALGIADAIQRTERIKKDEEDNKKVKQE